MAPIVKITPKSNGGFAKEFGARAASFRGAQIAARIQVPSDLTWWYFLEFGTATRQEDAPVPGPGAAYPIRPVDHGDHTLHTLAWPGEGGETVFRKLVPAHPGIRPHPFVRQAIPDILSQWAIDIRAALVEGGFRMSTIKDSLMEETMPYALALLVSNLAAAAPGTRPDGNLLGDTAASVFEEEAEIVDAGDFSPGNSFTKAGRVQPEPAGSALRPSARGGRRSRQPEPVGGRLEVHYYRRKQEIAAARKIK